MQTGPWRKLLCCPGISAESLEAGEAGQLGEELGLPGKVVSVGLLTAAAPSFSFRVKQTLLSSRCTAREMDPGRLGRIGIRSGAVTKGVRANVCAAECEPACAPLVCSLIYHSLHWPAISPHGSSVPRVTRAQAYGQPQVCHSQTG